MGAHEQGTSAAPGHEHPTSVACPACQVAEEVRGRLAAALDAAEIGSWELDPVTNRFTADAKTLELFGFPPDSVETRGEVFGERVPRSHRIRVLAALEASVRAGVDYQEEYPVGQPDGSLRWVGARGRAVHDTAGTCVRLVGAAYDTTPKHVEAERAEAANALVALIVSASEVLAGSLDAESAVRSFAQLMVPTLADWSVVSLVNDEGVLEDVASWHRDPDQVELTARFAAHRLEGRTDEVGSLQAFTSRQPFLLDEDVTGFARRVSRSAEAIDAVLELAPASVAVFPLLMADGSVTGLITLARGSARPAMSPDEVGAAVDVCRRATMALENARLFAREREMSEELQRSMLSEPVHPPHLEVLVRYLPAAKAAQVGGDWYDAFVQPDGASMLVVGDVVGHDSVAAAVMGQLRSMLRAVAVATGATPARLLSDLDRVLVVLEMATNATVLVARVESDPATDAVTLRWANAGHPPPVLAEPGRPVRALESHDLLLGVDPDYPRRDASIVLNPGAMLVLYTDGLVERRGEGLDVGIGRLAAAVHEVRDLPLERAVDLLLHHQVPDAPEDDVVLLAMRLRHGPASRGSYSEPPSSSDTES